MLAAPVHNDTNEDVDPGFVFVAKLGRLVKIVPDLPAQQNSEVIDSSVEANLDSDASEDEDCPLIPESGYKYIWKRDANGRKYFLSVPDNKVSASQPPTYIYDKKTGRTYREEVPLKQKVAALPQTKTRKTVENLSGQRSVFVDHRQAAGVIGSRSQPARDERLPTFVATEPEKQGRDTKIPELVQVARECPVAWTDKVTSDKLNVVLYTWSYVSSLLAARIGKVPDLEVGELEARLQHLLHVLEVTLQTSGPAEYTGDSWNIAKLYHQKVQQKVDSKQFSWVQLSTMHHSATLPHELMAATQELAIKPKLKVGGRGDGTKLGDLSGLRKDKNQICASWNRSEARGKCTYETENPRQKCKFVHECSWCTAKGLTPATHQRSFCLRKKDSEEE